MNLAPLQDYLSFLSGRYGMAILAAAAFFSILMDILWRTDERLRPRAILIHAGITALVVVSSGLLPFIFYKSYSGVRYDFWSLTLALYFMLLGLFTAEVIDQARNGDFRRGGIVLIVGLIAAVIPSPIVAGLVKLYERFHPLWP